MPPPSAHPSLSLHLLEGNYYIKQLHVAAPELPLLLDHFSQIHHCDGLLSITRTEDEISIIRQRDADEGTNEDMIIWRCIKVKGPMDFGTIISMHEKWV